MTQEEKNLLLKDLCARLQYGIFVEDGRNKLDDGPVLYTVDYHPCINDCKTYLRPMSSMTEEEKNDFREKFECADVNPYDFGYNEGGTLEDYISTIPFILIARVLDWLNSHYFDYRGLIKMGLALEASKGMYNF